VNMMDITTRMDTNIAHDITGIKGLNLFIVVLLNFLITITQIIGGLYAGSLSLISDALHNFSDGIAIAISYFAIKISSKRNDEKRTFGYKRATILAAFINSAILIIISIFLFKEAFFKFINPQPINGGIVIWVALVGLIANIIGVILLQKGSKGDMNIRSSYLHLLSDALSSVGVVIGGIVIYYFHLYWIDPIITIAIGLYVLKESFEIIKQAFNILLQGVPQNVNIEEIARELQRIDEVENIHHIHVWSLDEHNINFEAHINIKDMLVSETKSVLEKIEHVLKEHQINHITIQFEYNCCEDVGFIK
jgi:cobalt-zinc-cadmium efflux system protein